MDSLLKEIDDQMEDTGTHEWKIPLQEIGDETMEMIVHHNTMENKDLQGLDDIGGLRTPNHGPSSSSKKSIEFTEKIELYEYREEQEGSINRSGDNSLLRRSTYTFPVKEECSSEREVGHSDDDSLDENEENEDGEFGPSMDFLDPLSSKIRLTNAVEINNFNLKTTTKSSRLSVGSSDIGSGSDLETSTINDKYKLLEYNSLDDDKDESITPSSIGDHNPSSVYGFITDYESARETISRSNSELVSQRLGDSVENLGASTNISKTLSADTGIRSSISHDDILVDEKSYKSPDTTVNNGDASYTFDKVREDSRNTIGYDDIPGIVPSCVSGVAGANDIIPGAEYSKLVNDPDGFTIPPEQLGISDDGYESSQGSNASIEKGPAGSLPRLKKKVPNLPSLIPMIEPGPIFNEDPFEEVFDSSEDSLDRIRSVKPIDYISIWHNQADRFKSHSPAASAQSQFSERSFSSKSSISAPHTEFRFVSRVVSRCRYHNLEKGQPIFFNSDDDDDDDDDVIYMVDHAMDPRSRNALISRQARNSLKNNKKATRLKLTAFGLHDGNFKEQKKDDNPPFDSYSVTLSSTLDENKNSKEEIPEVQPREYLVKDDKLERGPSAGTSENSRISECQGYEASSSLINTPEVSHAEIPQSPLIGRDGGSMPNMRQMRGIESYPTFSPKYVGGKSPVVFPPANPSRNSNMPVLSPPARDISKRADLLTLAPAPKFRQLDKETIIKETPDINVSRPSILGYEEMQPEKQRFVELDLSRPISHDDTISIIDNLTFDGQFAPPTVKTKRGSHRIWNEGYNVIEDSNRRSSMSPEILDKLLQSEYGSDNVVTEQSRNSLSSRRYIKSPNDNVSVGRGLSETGLEAVISDEEVNERDSVLFDEFYCGTICQTPTQSSIGKLHVKSPLKPSSRNRSSSREIENLHHKQKGSENKTPVSSYSNETKMGTTSRCAVELDINGKIKNNPKSQINYPHKQVQVVAVKGTGYSDPVILDESEVGHGDLFPDDGTLYLRLRDVFGINLNGFKRRNAQFAVEVDNGKNVAQTPWKPMVREGHIDLNGEFEILLDKSLGKQGKIIMTLKCRYEKMVYEPKVEEVTEKVSVGSKRSLFGKKKERYEYQKKLIQKSPKLDKWEYMFAQDGSFGRYEVVVDKDFLEHAKFQVKTMKLDLKNEWARQQGASGKKPHQLPRIAPHVIGQLHLDVCYLCRTSVLEKFPRSLSIACGIVSKYESRQGIFKEGYLLQKGGDLHDETAKRFFKLQGNKLIGYHEVTRKAKIIINLLKVSNVIPPMGLNNRILDTDEKAQDSFHLIFANKEIITFDTEFSTKEKYDWYRKIDCVVDLNKSHQPWVKAFYEKSMNNV